MMTILDLLWRFMAVTVLATLSARKRGGTVGREKGLSVTLLGLRHTTTAVGRGQRVQISNVLWMSFIESGVP